MILELVDKGQIIDGKKDKPLKEQTTYAVLEKILKKPRLEISHILNTSENIIETKDYIIYRSFNDIKPERIKPERTGDKINKGDKGRVKITGELELRAKELHGKYLVLVAKKRNYTLQELADILKCSTMHLWNNLRDLSSVKIECEGLVIEGNMNVISDAKTIPYLWDGQTMHKNLTYGEVASITQCSYKYIYAYNGFLQMREWVASDKDPRTQLDKMKYLGFTEDKIYINTSPKQLIEILKFNKGYDTVIRNLKNKGIIKDGEKKIVKGEYFKYD